MITITLLPRKPSLPGVMVVCGQPSQRLSIALSCLKTLGNTWAAEPRGGLVKLFDRLHWSEDRPNKSSSSSIMKLYVHAID
ncbi:hypothetical protein RRG08_023860 [Elysia crispata]|uniref:Uncharacterized protein n=1 Tax=Elysia crispata TaxID=231223 RepID=A0AAE1AV97_9GAST|nr:hypothetical protein RRG08_023860 [Elysia crispata]